MNKAVKILDMDSDGLNMAAEGNFLFIRRNRAMYKYDLRDMSVAARAEVFKKDGKARGFSICRSYIFLTDFCDLHILDKETLRVAESFRLGEDLTSDLGAVRFGAEKAYICVRNGRMAVMDLATKAVVRYDISDSSFWDHCVADGMIYAGTVKGELIKIGARDMRILNKTNLCKKNIYSVVYDEGAVYTVSQDATVKSVAADTFETLAAAKKAVRGMAKLLGTHGDTLAAADSGQISLWNKHTLELLERFAFPTGAYNKGAILHGGKLYGSDFSGVYVLTLE